MRRKQTKYLGVGVKLILSGVANPAKSVTRAVHYEYLVVFALTTMKRESTASIRDTPRSYLQSSSMTSKNIIDVDCRGLEFVEFKAQVTKINLRSRTCADSMLGRVESYWR